MAKRTNKNEYNPSLNWHFEFSNPIWMILIAFGMLYVSLLAYFPELIPFETMGFLGDIGRILNQDYRIATLILFWFAWGLHILEAIYVIKVATDSKLRTDCKVLWFIQTVLFGYASTKLILKYRNKITKMN